MNDIIVSYLIGASVVYKGCYTDVPNDTKDMCDDESYLDCKKCDGNNCNTDMERRGKRCYKCSGLTCFTAGYPNDVSDCLSDCFVGTNSE